MSRLRCFLFDSIVSSRSRTLYAERCKGNVLVHRNYSALVNSNLEEKIVSNGLESLQNVKNQAKNSHWNINADSIVPKSIVDPELPLSSIIKVYATSTSPNYSIPWQSKHSRESTGSGFVLGKYIVTNAHVVADANFIMVRKHGHAERVIATVVAVGHDCDLALLSVEPSFLVGVASLELGNVPALDESVTVLGYPTGGDNLSVTRGVVSRIEPTSYAHGMSTLLALQIDAAINPGNSGGPALIDGKVVGVAFQNLSNAENIGFVIPVPIISHFLRDVEKGGVYAGFCALGIQCQTMENQRLREYKLMHINEVPLSGVLVTKINMASPAASHFQIGDVILSMDGYTIGNDGTIYLNSHRILFDHLITMKHVDENVKLDVLRNGAKMVLHVPLAPPVALVPPFLYDRSPSYFIFSGLCFVPLSQPMLWEWGDEWFHESPRKLCDIAINGEMETKDQQVIVLSHVLAHALTVGYTDLKNGVVKKVNSIKILNLKHLLELVEAVKEGLIVFEMDDGKLIVLNAQESRIKSKEILDIHRIPHDRSVDLK